MTSVNIDLIHKASKTISIPMFKTEPLNQCHTILRALDRDSTMGDFQYAPLMSPNDVWLAAGDSAHVTYDDREGWYICITFGELHIRLYPNSNDLLYYIGKQRVFNTKQLLKACKKLLFSIHRVQYAPLITIIFHNMGGTSIFQRIALKRLNKRFK